MDADLQNTWENRETSLLRSVGPFTNWHLSGGLGANQGNITATSPEISLTTQIESGNSKTIELMGFCR